MANIKDCPGFETFGADVKEARKVKQLSRKTLAEQVNIDWRYLANIENDGTIPSLPVIIQLIKICGLPVERYFNPEIMREESAQRQRVSHKLKLCPEEFLPVIEGAIDGAIQIHDFSSSDTSHVFSLISLFNCSLSQPEYPKKKRMHSLILFPCNIYFFISSKSPFR